MLNLLWLIPTLPLLGCTVLALFGRMLPRKLSAIIGAGTVGLSAVITLGIAFEFVPRAQAGEVFVQHLWTWMDVQGFTPGIAFHLDSLSLLMVFVVTFVGFIIHVYSSEYMAHDAAYARFFAYMNLFVCMMLVLVLADNLVLLYLGWEGVGLCSYLLIGFWYQDPANGRAARKAFVVTRVGDASLAVAMFFLFERLGTLHIQQAMDGASAWGEGSGAALAVALLLLGGAVGKSAQLPLQTWLPDAMAGPTPVSALIHAATMVTAGVYLIARMHVVFELAPAAMMLVAVVGVATLLLAGFSAIVQSDIKRILAYSTISQIGYMFLALGVGAWGAAMFHFMTHAFFKALLFLAAGYVIESVHHEQNIFKMGGLRKYIRGCYWTFLIGAASLSALPLVTAGFYSKDLILLNAWQAENGGFLLWMGGAVGAFLTALYSFRLIFVVFFGERHASLSHIPGWRMMAPLVILAFFAIAAGFIETPHTLGHVTLFSHYIAGTLPAGHGEEPSLALEIGLQSASSILAILGLLTAWALYMPARRPAEKIALSSAGRTLGPLWASGWGFDWIYDKLLVRPVLWFARVNRSDLVDFPYQFLAWSTRGVHYVLGATVTGNLRFYAAGITAGAVVILAIMVIF